MYVVISTYAAYRYKLVLAILRICIGFMPWFKVIVLSKFSPAFERLFIEQGAASQTAMEDKIIQNLMNLTNYPSQEDVSNTFAIFRKNWFMAYFEF